MKRPKRDIEILVLTVLGIIGLILFGLVASIELGGI